MKNQPYFVLNSECRIDFDCLALFDPTELRLQSVSAAMVDREF